MLFFSGIKIKTSMCLLLAALMVLAVMSCKQESPPARKAPVQSARQAGESLFDEVKKKVEKDPADADAWFHLADLYERNSQYSEAIDSYKKVIKLKPGSGYVYLKIGTAYNRLNSPEEALTAFKKAVKLMPGYAVAYNNMAISYGKLGRTDEEISALKKAVKLRPRYSSARYNLGIVYLKTGNKKAASSEYEALKDFDSGAAEALMKEIRGTK